MIRCQHVVATEDDEGVEAGACGFCISALTDIPEPAEVLFDTAKKIAALVDVDGGFAIITDAHEFVKEIKTLKELTK